MSSNKKTVNMILSVITITLAAKFLGFFRDALLGSKIGATFESDAYIMALNSTTIIFLSIGSAISTAAIPLIVKRLKDKDSNSTNLFLNKLIGIIFLGAISIAVIGIFVAPSFLGVIAKGFYGEKQELVITLTRIMFPSLIFISVAYLFVAFLQSRGKFIVPALISFPFNIVLIFYLIVFLKYYGIVGLAFATLMGWSLQLLIQIPFAIKEGYRFKLVFDFKDEDVKKFLISLLPIIFVTSLHQINILVDNMYASTLGDGRVSSIYYANILYQAIVTTTVYGISAVMFPKFNLNLTADSLNRFRDLVLSVLSTVIYLLVPMSVGLLVLNNTIISFVFERGQFDAQTTSITSMILAYYAIGMVGFGIIDILNKAFYSLNNVRVPVIISMTVIVVNYILSKILLSYMGFQGVALATSISLLFGALLLIYLFKRKIDMPVIRILGTSLIKILSSSFIMAIGIIYFKQYLVKNISINGSLDKLIILISVSSVGVLIYALSTILMKDKTSVFIFENYIKSKLNKLKKN